MHARRRPSPLAAPLLVLALAAVATTVSPTGAADRDRQRVGAEVVGGKAVPDGRYPFVAALLDTRRGEDAFQQQFCGGSLVARSWVLTAAHCVTNPTPPAAVLRVVGRTVLSSSQGTTRGVSRIIVHPAYNAARFSNDAALLELDAPILDGAPITTAGAGGDAPDSRGTRVVVAGWGDACQGDSGGPLFAKVDDDLVEVGIVSFGIGCGARFPGVYTRLSPPTIADFVESVAGGPGAGGASAKDLP